MERNTPQKAIILQTVRSMKNHPSADEVYAKVSTICPNISKATVYRGLNKFADDGEILRVPVANAPDRYDFHAANHAHFLCSECGRVFDFPLRSMPEIDSANSKNFRVSSFSIIVNGVCKECQKIKNKKEKTK